LGKGLALDLRKRPHAVALEAELRAMDLDLQP
jgi:hypothetical protein